jgi:hypothetical protein
VQFRSESRNVRDRVGDNDSEGGRVSTGSVFLITGTSGKRTLLTARYCTFGSIKRGKFVGKLSNCYLFKKYSAALGYLLYRITK